MLLGTGTECFEFSEQKPAAPNRMYPPNGYISRIEFSQKQWEIGGALNRLLPKSFVLSGGKNPPLSARLSFQRTCARATRLDLIFRDFSRNAVLGKSRKINAPQAESQAVP
jgi:hypothetical protein